MTPVERVARALCRIGGTDPDALVCIGVAPRWPKGFVPVNAAPAWLSYVSEARGAIGALRPELQAARDHIEGVTGARPGSDSEEVVQMISAVLSEGE